MLSWKIKKIFTTSLAPSFSKKYDWQLQLLKKIYKASRQKILAYIPPAVVPQWQCTYQAFLFLPLCFLSIGISATMVQNEDFFHIQSASKDDPRVSRHALNHASRQNNGPCFKTAIRPMVSLFHYSIFTITIIPYGIYITWLSVPIFHHR